MAKSFGNEPTPENIGHKRTPKPTERALQDKLHRLIGTRNGKFCQLTTKMKEIDKLMQSKDNVYKVQTFTHIHYLHEELVTLNDSIIPLTDEEEREVDQERFTDKLTSV